MQGEEERRRRRGSSGKRGRALKRLFSTPRLKAAAGGERGRSQGEKEEENHNK